MFSITRCCLFHFSFISMQQNNHLTSQLTIFWESFLYFSIYVYVYCYCHWISMIWRKQFSFMRHQYEPAISQMQCVQMGYTLKIVHHNINKFINITFVFSVLCCKKVFCFIPLVLYLLCLVYQQLIQEKSLYGLWVAFKHYCWQLLINAFIL